MRVTLLGHASLLVEGEGACVAMDPVFVDPFEHGLTVSCPRRQVHVDALPRLNAIVLSHGHADHFDLASLAMLPRETPIILPADRRVHHELREAGFAHLRAVQAGDSVSLGGVTCHFTGSVDADELGAVFSDRSGSVWNQVDTATTAAESARVVAGLGGRLDAALCPYNPLIEWAEFWVEEVEFPVQRYERLLEAAIATRARTVIPGSFGQRLVGKREWINRRAYPVTREQFLRDLADVAPEIQGLRLNPGEGAVIQAGHPARVETTPYASVIDTDVDRIRFCPEEQPVPLLVDANPGGVSEEVIARALDEMTRTLVRRFEAALVPELSGPLRVLWDRRAVIQIEIVLPSQPRALHLAQWLPRPVWQATLHPDPDYRFAFVGSELYAYLHGQIDRWGVTLRATRRAPRPYREGGRFRFNSLEPARLNGEDPYFVVDEDFAWNPLSLVFP